MLGARWTASYPLPPLLCIWQCSVVTPETEAVPVRTIVTEVTGLQGQPAPKSCLFSPLLPASFLLGPSSLTDFTPTQDWESVVSVRMILYQLWGETGQTLHRGEADLREDGNSTKVTQQAKSGLPESQPKTLSWCFLCPKAQRSQWEGDRPGWISE